MTAPQLIDPERLAALLDGRLSDIEAAAVRAQLANAHDETLAAYADAVAVFAELNGEVGAVVPIESARSRRRWFAPSAAAAAAAAIITVFVLRPSAYQPAKYANTLAVTAHAVDGPVWSVTRGGSDGISDRARAVRIGALLTDLQVDALRGDSATAHASALATLIGGALGQVAQATALREFTNSSAGVLTIEQASTLGAQSTRNIDQVLMNGGAYLEAARIASARGDMTFFEKIPPSALSALGADAGSVLSLINAKPRDAAAIHGAVERLMRMLAR